MFKTLANIFRIPELRNKILFTLALLCVYRIGFYVPLPGVDAGALFKQAASSSSVLGAISGYLSLFSGGNLGQSTIFGLGIMPYISASIIFQLLGTVIPSLEKMQKEGESGRRKLNEWTRYATVGLCLLQGTWWISTLTNTPGLIYWNVAEHHIAAFWIMGLLALTAGSVFLMWLGEQIDQFGIGNGVSLIIMAGIVSRMPDAIIRLASNTTFKLSGSEPGKYSFIKILFLMAAFVFVVGGSILLTQAQRRIKIQQAKHMRGRRVYGGQSQYLPLRVNHGGVMPIIFASSLMLFPTVISRWAGNHIANRGVGFFIDQLAPGSYIYEVFYIAMIFFFSYFWNTVQFQPKEMATQLRDYGSFIPGLRPGKRTADYLEAVLMRITYVGAAFLSIIAVLPTVLSTQMNIDQGISQFLGGTGLLIVISVMLDVINRVEANLVMRHYNGLNEAGGGGPKGRQNGENRKGMPA